MIKLVRFFKFIPFVNNFLEKRLYACGYGTYSLNMICKYLFFLNRGKYLIHFTSRINSPNKVKIISNGKNTVHLSFATSGGCYYQAINGIEIGEGTIWSYNCSFISANHAYKNLTAHIRAKPLKIGYNVWIASNCVLLPEIEIGDFSIIGAGSIVTKDIPAYSIAVGNPAKVIAKRCEKCLKKIKIDETCICS
ncbi:acyltransferase [Planktosalinus lacus]|uniref:Acyltransferase n=1 Tax=Planktosalinus lacus TaxID=1526573 RepID=A0A8J2Y9S9_9FLAO|nr:acyltransferase [Planktosalinus lacus]GGE00598.1 hypothetical protein GCM10011312_25080 [Planktosalinus lacus]